MVLFIKESGLILREKATGFKLGKMAPNIKEIGLMINLMVKAH